MANAVHRTTKEYRTSVDVSELPGTLADWLVNPDLSAVVGLPTKFWKIVGDTVSAMTQAEQDAVTAAEAAALTAALKAAAINAIDTQRAEAAALLRALALVTADELNVLRTWTRQLKIEIAAATNLANLQTRVATLATLADRTDAQVKQAIKDEVTSGAADV